MPETTMVVPGMSATGPRVREVVLRTHNLSKQYGKRLAVDNLNLEVQRGEIFGFLGPNGAGKTTTIRMSLGLITPTAGSVEILGQDIATHKSHILPGVGALVETPALYTYLSGRSNLRAVGSVLGGVPSTRIDYVLDFVGLKGRKKVAAPPSPRGRKRPGGVPIALRKALVFLPLKNPANGLDPAGIVEMRDLMHRLSAEGKTVFISSHLLSEAQQICTRVAIFNLGKLVKESTIEDLTSGHGEFSVTVVRAAEALALEHQ